MNALRAGAVVLVPLPNGHCGLIWIIETEGSVLRFLLLEGTWPGKPTSAEVAAARPARAQGARLPGQPDIRKGWIDQALPSDLTIVDQRAVSETELEYVRNHAGTMIFGDGERLRDTLLTNWRLAHEPDALRAEWAAERSAQQRRSEARRARLTLGTMLREKAFPSWEEQWPGSVVREVRRIFRDATEALIALDEHGTEAQRTEVLKGTVSELNTLDDTEGCMETPEREQAIARIEELAALVGLSNEDEALTGHRDW